MLQCKLVISWAAGVVSSCVWLVTPSRHLTDSWLSTQEDEITEISPLPFLSFFQLTRYGTINALSEGEGVPRRNLAWNEGNERKTRVNICSCGYGEVGGGSPPTKLPVRQLICHHWLSARDGEAF